MSDPIIEGISNPEPVVSEGTENSTDTDIEEK